MGMDDGYGMIEQNDETENAAAPAGESTSGHGGFGFLFFYWFFFCIAFLTVVLRLIISFPSSHEKINPLKVPDFKQNSRFSSPHVQKMEIFFCP
ncbi:hypothetical protein [Enterocloster citroniae]|uniref:hypothetical protein n=2 Tax=Bacillota TaxID=1239 RepID=UPI002E7847CD|nr:hypothetical protein [Enterocloster citroniae]